MKRLWTTKIEGRGRTPSEALAFMLEDNLADLLSQGQHRISITTVYPENPSIEQLAAWKSESDIPQSSGWKATAEIEIEYDMHVP